MPLNLPIYVIVGERPLFAIRTADGGMAFKTWDFAEDKFVIGGADDWDALLDGGIDQRRVTKKEFDAHVASLRRKTTLRRP